MSVFHDICKAFDKMWCYRFVSTMRHRQYVKKIVSYYIADTKVLFITGKSFYGKTAVSKFAQSVSIKYFFSRKLINEMVNRT